MKCSVGRVIFVWISRLPCEDEVFNGMLCSQFHCLHKTTQWLHKLHGLSWPRQTDTKELQENKKKKKASVCNILFSAGL